ncbi:MAG: hypothetical protein H6817_09000 [Phycisphaerales bacterium]|nr:hypothetical protein [Phycisphaerales bacterium]
MSDEDITIQRSFHFVVRKRGRREIKPGPKPVPPKSNSGTVPRISRLMALAIKFDGLIRSGAITDQAELANLAHVTRARVTQIMNLLHLAPDIQEAILFLPKTTKGRDPIREAHVRPIAAEACWDQQRQAWHMLEAHTIVG